MPPPSTGHTDPDTAGPGHDLYRIQGRELTVPVHIPHARAGTALYSARADAVAAELPSGLSPVEIRPGRTVVAIAAVQYVDNPLGHYDEGVVASVVRPSTEPGAAASLRDVVAGRYGIFVHHMPVSQAFTREAGDRIWGLPKTLDTLDLRHTARRAGLRWSNDAGEMLRLTVPRGGRLPVPPRTTTIYTVRDGVVWRTRASVHGTGLRIAPLGAALRLGTHPVAERLRRFDLGGGAIATCWVEHATMDLQRAAPVR